MRCAKLIQQLYKRINITIIIIVNNNERRLALRNKRDFF